MAGKSKQGLVKKAEASGAIIQRAGATGERPNFYEWVDVETGSKSETLFYTEGQAAADYLLHLDPSSPIVPTAPTLTASEAGKVRGAIDAVFDAWSWYDPTTSNESCIFCHENIKAHGDGGRYCTCETYKRLEGAHKAMARAYNREVDMVEYMPSGDYDETTERLFDAEGVGMPVVAPAPALLDALNDCITEPGATCMVHNRPEYYRRRLLAINGIVYAAIAKMGGKGK